MVKDDGVIAGAVWVVAVEDGEQALDLGVVQHLYHLLLDLRRLERLQDVGVGVAVLVEPGAEGPQSPREALDVSAGQRSVLVLVDVGVAVVRDWSSAMNAHWGR
jgi:hypothetical protein